MKLLSVHDAQQRILMHFRSVEIETLPLEQCAGRVLASEVFSTTLPLFDNSSVDGFAVIAADLDEAPRTLKVVADIPAGSESQPALGPGQAARIMTGAPIPPNATAVVMLEETEFAPNETNVEPPSEVRVLKSVRPGQNIRRRGMDLQSGQKIFLRGHRIRAQDLGMLAMLDESQVAVFRRPKVALLSSGNELVAADAPLSPGKIRDANSYVLTTLVAEAGCQVLPLGIARDDRTDVRQRMEQAIASQADLIISTAGVSAGALDMIRDTIAAEGQLDFWGVNVRPGKPLAFGAFHGVPFLGLPGNPVSAYVGFELFVRPALANLAGLKHTRRPAVKVIMEEPVESDGRESYLRVIIEDRADGSHAKLTGHQGSGNLLSLVEANALLLVPAGVKSLAVGDQAEAWLL